MFNYIINLFEMVRFGKMLYLSPIPITWEKVPFEITDKDIVNH